MNNLFRISIFAVLLQGGSLWAQDPDAELHSVPTPQPPFVARAPEKSSWAIEIKPVDKGPVSPGSIPGLPQKYLKKQLWIKSGPMMKCVNDWADGTKTEDWVTGRVKFFQDPQLSGFHILSPQNPIYHDFGTSDFEMLDWMGADDYMGAFIYAGQPCYLFQAKEIAGPGGTETGAHNKTIRQLNAPASPTKVYISVKTKLPVAIINGDGEFSFKYLPASDEPLVMPQPVASLSNGGSGH